MNLIITFCVVYFVCFGADYVVSSGTEETQEANLEFTESMCPSPYDRLLNEMKILGDNCFKKALPETERWRYQNSSTIEEHREFARIYCQGQTSVRNCLAETATKIEVCQNKDYLNTFKIYRDVAEKVLDFGCSDNGEKVAALIHGMEDIVKSKDASRAVKKCLNRFQVTFSDLDGLTIDISSKFFNIYKEFKILAECFDQIDDVEDSPNEAIKLFLGELMKTMKCVHPQDDTLVPCGTIDAGSIATPTVCDMYLKQKEANGGTEIPLYDVLEENSWSCLTSFLHYPDSEMEDNDSLRRHIGSMCEAGLDDEHCYPRSKIISDICLNDTEQHQFNLLGDFMKSGFRIACSEGDERLIVVVTEVYRLKNSGKGNAISDCVNEVLNRNVTESSKNMRFYHDVVAFKECFVNKLEGNQPSVDAVRSLINDMLKEVKCVHPTESTEVPCETLHVT